MVMPEIFLDHRIAFTPSAFPVYLSLWVYVSLPPALLGNLRVLVGYTLWVGALCLMCLGIFWWWPTQVPAFGVDWAAYPGLALIKGIDASGNAFPSLHVASAVFSACWLHRIFRQLGCPKLLENPLQNALRSVIARARAVHCVVFLVNSRAIGCKQAPCGPSRSARHILASVVQRVLNAINIGFCIAIAWSTMATLQHVALDVIGGVVAGLLFAAASLANIRDTAPGAPAQHRPAV
jgi:hypothetical protein